jgi:hypothetical protein
MLVGVDSSDSLVETLRGQKWWALLLGLGLASLLFFAIGTVVVPDSIDGVATVNEETGNITRMAELIFGPYVWAFEVTSALLITAALGGDGCSDVGLAPAPPRVDTVSSSVGCERSASRSTMSAIAAARTAAPTMVTIRRDRAGSIGIGSGPVDCVGSGCAVSSRSMRPSGSGGTVRSRARDLPGADTCSVAAKATSLNGRPDEGVGIGASVDSAAMRVSSEDRRISSGKRSDMNSATRSVAMDTPWRTVQSSRSNCMSCAEGYRSSGSR